MTSIVDMTSGVSLKAWLCPDHIAHRKTAAGGNWSVKVIGEVAFGCDDCQRVEQRAHGYTSPPVDYVETAPESFCPPPGWVAPAVPETWAAYLAGKKAAR